MANRASPRAKRILVLDIGGTHVKAAISDRPTVYRVTSGPTLTPQQMLRKLGGWLKSHRYDLVSIGYPGLVVHGRIVREPPNLGPGWVGFDLPKAFNRPTRIINDAAMQALGSYRGGRMLFLGLGTGLGTAMIVDDKLEPMELAHLPFKKGRTYEEYVGEAGLRRLGRKKWQKEVFAVVKTLSDALEPDYVVLGGGNVRKLKDLPPRAHEGDNRNAIIGGIRLWADLLPRPAGSAPTRLRRRPARAGGRQPRGSLAI
jgi:predicted NBD/HSP70 family sugar kinase